ncbi:PH domain-containing protein [Ornithinibacillus halotolerans]|uniref:Membrane protein n=1 Tax=Ornithinibacillus halotolerans TaxID=1274357 RepID=A0A916W2D4_9BACI|nr:PH domain-containing protein [Ornithinibacillus halotolerans]GGA60663.1 membrane protein [Ornithinibacillus halotolerans]
MSDRKLENTLSPIYPKIKRITALISKFIQFIILGVLIWMYSYFDWPTWIYWVLIGLIVLNVFMTIWSIFEPHYYYRSWSYQFDEEYLQLSYGIFQKEWVTVPMTKIQSVTTTQGPIMKRYQIRSISVETVGSSHVIPALEEEVAFSLREKLAEFAKLKEVGE